ncbi:MAG TPA: ATP-binding protein, partial [Candidatus Melainabacteria bacterium]|nr:ATP-binding protein [Candidatus Melainabacteria bacterium]
IRKKNIYRGKILSTSQEGGGLKFHDLPPVTRNRIILPDGLLKRIERQTIEAGKHSEALKKAKRKLKRGILLHGKPGTGKTLTAMYLASEMKERTVILMTGRGQGSIESSCRFARWLEPFMAVIEDVDLIAEDRTKQQGCNTAILLELLNEMDGLSDDVDVLFFLTTNRPDVLEPALAARPGRVDQAYEIPLPDRECRKRLFELYIEGMDVEVEDMEPYVKRTQGASGAFIAEIMRKAALFAAADGEPIVVKDNHMDEAMHELLVVGGTLTKSLLGSGEIGFTPTGFKDS